MTAFTHTGWLGLCPVHVADPYGGAPALKARAAWLEWWLDLNEVALGAAGFVISLINPAFEPLWPIRITGELASPIEVPE